MIFKDKAHSYVFFVASEEDIVQVIMGFNMVS